MNKLFSKVSSLAAGLFLLAATAPAASAADVKFVMQQGASAFAATLGQQCLSGEPGASITAKGDLVTVSDKAACAKEIRTIADNWILYGNESIVSLAGTPEALTMVREKLEQRFGRSPNQNLRFLAPTQTCRCLAFVGRKEDKAADLGASLLPKPTKSVPTAETSAGVDAPWTSGRHRARNDEGLIQGTVSMPVGASEAPLVN